MKQKIYLLAIALIIIGGLAQAQNNVVKIKPVRLGLKQLSLEYERVIIPRLSASLNFTYQMPYQIAQVDLDGSSPELTGYSISPAIRFYPNIAKETPRGFYLEGFFKYNKNELTLPYSVDISSILDPNAPPTPSGFPTTSQYDLIGSLTMVGGGIALGTQWLIADRVSIDWKWLGFGAYSTTLGLDVAGNLPYDPALVSGGQDFNPKWKDVEGLLSDGIGDLPGPGIEVNSTDGVNGAGSVGVSTTGIIALPRFAFTLGFAF